MNVGKLPDLNLQLEHSSEFKALTSNRFPETALGLRPVELQTHHHKTGLDIFFSKFVLSLPLFVLCYLDAIHLIQQTKNCGVIGSLSLSFHI